jgi:hypothetical protein
VLAAISIIKRWESAVARSDSTVRRLRPQTSIVDAPAFNGNPNEGIAPPRRGRWSRLEI